MADEAPKTDLPTSEHGHAPPTTAGLMASAKTLAEGAQSAFQEGGVFDKAKVAGAAEDVLEGAKSYGKLDDNSGAGQYVNKAEGYLHNLHSSDSTPAAPATAAKDGEGAEKVEEKVEKVVEKEEESSGGGASDVLNMAKKGFGGLFK